MAQWHMHQVSRSDRAVGIVERHETLLRDDGSWQVRDTVGSGRWHIVLEGHCDCPDYVYRHMTCKHLRAVAAEERSLAQYAATWDARSEQQRLSTRNEYRGPYGSDGWPEPRPCCPDCGAELVSQSYHIGGRGMIAFLVCSKDAEHRAMPA
jgi:predicted nucleic acid-binding Zn finger protein